MPAMEQDIRFCTTSDGASIAYATGGTGPVLIVPPAWVSHLQSNESISLLTGRLSETHTVVRWDKRGTGLSTHEVTEYSIECCLLEAEAVLAALDVERADFFGLSQGGPITVAFAAAHPEILAALVWGAAVSALLYRTKNLWACIAAHAVTNALLGLYILVDGAAWRLW